MGSCIIINSNLWDTVDPQTVAFKSPIVCFLYTFYRVLHGNFISKHIQNGFVWKYALRKKTFCKNYKGLSIFFYFWHFYATGLRSFVVYIGPHQWWWGLNLAKNVGHICPRQYWYGLMLYFYFRSSVSWTRKIECGSFLKIWYY